MNNVTIETLSGVFLGLTVAMAAFVIRVFSRYLEGRARITTIVLFLSWLAYVGILGYRGVIATTRPPGPLFVVLPVVLFLAFYLIRNPGVRDFAKRVPVAVFIGAETFRIVVEWALHGLYRLGLTPQMLTYEGANFDILVGVSAPIVALFYANRMIGVRALRAWNWFGIAMLVNVLLRAFLTFRGAMNFLHTEVPNRAVGIFPFTFLPGFLAPLALYMHVLILRAISGK